VFVKRGFGESYRNVSTSPLSLMLTHAPSSPLHTHAHAHAHTDCLIGYCSMMKKEKGNLKPFVGMKTPVRSVSSCVCVYIYMYVCVCLCVRDARCL
jgi:hypothetical protein